MFPFCSKQVRAMSRSATSAQVILSHLEHLRHQDPLGVVEAAPKSEEGEFVGIFDKLSRQWAADKRRSAIRVVNFDAEMQKDYPQGIP
ncbi:protein of unknown function (plasmid) [Rhodovastum atsumiense]|nr:protein of unknown function [Rhodovastum atsumiense]